MSKSHLALALVLSLLLSGCGRHWLVGKWTLDREATVAGLSDDPSPARNAGEGFLKEVAAGLQKGVATLLLAGFEGVEIEFTPTERRRHRQGGGDFEGYRIIERPAPDRVVLQFDGGQAETWAKAGGGIRLKLPGEEERWVVFRRVE
jgi:hypothetical protein